MESGNCNACIYTLCLPANDEMRHGDQEGPKRHQDTSDCYDLGSVEFGTKIAHKGNNQQIPFMVEMIRKGDAYESKTLYVIPTALRILQRHFFIYTRKVLQNTKILRTSK